jgi:hypothetical protein
VPDLVRIELIATHDQQREWLPTVILDHTIPHRVRIIELCLRVTVRKPIARSVCYARLLGFPRDPELPLRAVSRVLDCFSGGPNLIMTKASGALCTYFDLGTPEYTVGCLLYPLG